MDAELEEKVAQWKAAKECKDWSTADSLRAELRQAGFDPDKPRQRNAQDPELELQLHQWQIAKQNKDFDTADAIREEMRAKGVEPDAPRGKGGSKGSSLHESSFLPGFMAPFMSNSMTSFMTPHSDWRPYDSSVERDLDQWVEAKHSKDYSTADAIRTSLRERGHSPAKERPLNGGAQDEVAQWTRAKKAKDFARSDRIRESLRAQNIDPEKFNGAAAASLFHPMWSQAAPVTAKRGSSNKPKPSLGRMDSVTIEELNQWFDAKEQKNFTVADAIRDTLRAKGVEPAHCQKPGSAGLDVTMEAELQEWFEARDAKDWATADRIREGLRAKGVEPSQCQRPDGDASAYGKTGPASRGGSRSTPYASGRGGGASGGFDRATEAQLDEWWKHKQDKNFGLADGLRSELRDQGIEPEHHRPRK